MLTPMTVPLGSYDNFKLFFPGFHFPNIKQSTIEVMFAISEFGFSFFCCRLVCVYVVVCLVRRFVSFGEYTSGSRFTLPKLLDHCIRRLPTSLCCLVVTSGASVNWNSLAAVVWHRKEQNAMSKSSGGERYPASIDVWHNCEAAQ